MVTQGEIDAMRAAAARGVLQVRFADGRQVTYASPDQLLRAAAELEGRLQAGTFQRTTFSSFARD